MIFISGCESRRGRQILIQHRPVKSPNLSASTGQISRYTVAHEHEKRNPTVEIKPIDVLKPVHTTKYARVDAKELSEMS